MLPSQSMEETDAVQVIPVLNFKGGVGKTTTCVNLAASLQRTGHRVLVADLDGQRSASIHFGVDRHQFAPTSADVLFGRVPLAEAILTTPVEGLDILPGSPDLAQADVLLDGGEHPVGALTEALRPARGFYDFILIDCSPTCSLLSVNILVAADALIVPVRLSPLAMKGLETFETVTKKVWTARKRVIPMLGILRTMYDPESASQRELDAVVCKRYGGKVFQTVIHECPEIPAAARAQRPLVYHAPNSACATNYLGFAREVESRAARYGRVFPRACRLDAGQEFAVSEATLGY